MDGHDAVSSLNLIDVDKLLAYEYVWPTIDNREKNAEVAGLAKVHEHKIGENVRGFEVKF